MTKICLTCKVSKSMNQAELEKVIPEWYKEIGNYSLLPPILNNNDKYNAKTSTLQVRKPDITDYEVKVDIEDKKNTWICYWAANYTDKYDKIKTAKQAYDKFQNHGLVKTDGSGKAVLTLNCPQPYSVDGITYPRHVHYCLLNKDKFWSDDIKTVIVSCDVNFRLMKKFVKDKCHLIINVLSKQSFDRCKIPGSINIPLLTFQQDDATHIIRKSLNDFDKLNKFKGNKLYEVPIVVYCKNTECKASDRMIELLIEAGFRNLLEYSEGVMGWMRKSKSKKSCDDDYDEKVGGGSSFKIDDKQFKLNISENKIVDGDKIYTHNMDTNVLKIDDKVVGKYKSGKIILDKDKKEEKKEDKKEEKKEEKKEDKKEEKKEEKKSESQEDKKSESSNKFTDYDSDSSSESSDYSSEEEEEIKKDIKTLKSDIESIKYRKHKLSLVCMNNITPKIYEEKFRGWGFTFWGS